MRYVGQSYEIETISCPRRLLRAVRAQTLAEAFHEAHRANLQSRRPAAAVEMVNLRVRVIGQLPPRLERSPQLDHLAGAESTGSRAIIVDGARRLGVDLRPRRAGPRSTHRRTGDRRATRYHNAHPSGWVAVVDRFGNLAITLEARA